MNFNFKLLSFAIIGLAVPFLLFFIYSNTADSIAPGLSHTIELREDGFYPKEITIEKGSTVTFRTTLNRSFWPASSRHPVHELYPELDPKQPVSPAESWSFVFDKVGIWGYHDHLFSKYTGTIIVLDTKNGIKSEKNIPRACESESGAESEQAQCLTQRLIETTRKKGLEKGFDLLSLTYAPSSYFHQNVCHGLTHQLGNIAYERFRAGENIKPDSRFDYCGFGFYHGFIESMLYDTKDIFAARTFCDDILKNKKGVPGMFNSCIHGFGHGVTDTAPPETWGNPQAIVAPGLQFCEQITNSEYDLENCSGGVFNALATMQTKPEYKLITDSDDPLKICGEQRRFEFRSSCYRNFKAFLFHIVAERDFPKAARYIEKIADDILAERAMDNLALHATRYLVGEGHKTDEELISYCRLIEKRLLLSCITGFSVGFMNFGIPGKEYDRGVAFCEQKLFSDDEQRACFKRIGWIASQEYTAKKHEEFCSAITPENRFFCPEYLPS